MPFTHAYLQFSFLLKTPIRGLVMFCTIFGYLINTENISEYALFQRKILKN